MASPKLRLRLLVDNQSQKVLFAEAGKEEMDFLFSILSLPLGTVTRLLSRLGMVGCLGNLYNSIQNLDQSYLQPDQDKDSLLKPNLPASAPQIPLLLSDDGADLSTPRAKQFYKCPNHNYMSESSETFCPACRYRLSQSLTYVASDVPTATPATSGGGGFVKGVVTYMVMDDLVVTPMSTISSIVLLNKFNVRDVSSLEERLVDLGMDEGLKILKASLECQNVLTSIFLGKHA